MIVTSKILGFWLFFKTIFSHKPVEKPSKLCSKRLKKEESLEECINLECQNVVHPSHFKKVLAAFAEDEWEGPSFCGKWCFNNQRKSAMA